MNKKVRTILITLCLLSSVFLASCKNFLNGNEVLNELNNTIEYLNANYVVVNINALNSYTESVSPAAGIYEKSYKKSDSIELSFEEKSEYQFVGWKASPEDSVSFEDSKSKQTKVKIVKEVESIVIEPVICERPFVSISPKNVVAVEKNTPVIITFSKPMDISADDLQRIQINSLSTSVLEYYQIPELSEDKTTVTFLPKEKMISFEGDNLNLTVIVPEDFYYLYGEQKITLEKQVSYTFMINNQTLTKLKAFVRNQNPSSGSLNLTGENNFNIGQSYNLLLNIFQEYEFVKWCVKNSEGQEIPVDSYSEFFVFDDVYSPFTNITIKKLGSGFVIEAISEERPKVLACMPNYDRKGVDRASDIHIIFNQPMSEDTVYFTEDEQKKIKEENTGKTVSFIKSENKDSYYAYSLEDENGKTEVFYKSFNILLNKEAVNNKYFGEPYFANATNDTELIIPTIKDKYQVPPSFADIEVEININCVNKKNISLANRQSFLYRTNGGFDISAPEVTIKNTDLMLRQGVKMGYGNKGRFSCVVESNPQGYSDVYTFDSINKMNSVQGVINQIGYAKTMKLYGGDFKDDGDIAYITCVLTPYNHSLFPVDDGAVPVKITKSIDVLPITNENSIVFDFSDYHIKGIFNVSFEVYDSVGNVTIVDKINDNALGSYYLYTVINTEKNVGINDIEVESKINRELLSGVVKCTGTEATVNKGPQGFYSTYIVKNEVAASIEELNKLYNEKIGGYTVLNEIKINSDNDLGQKISSKFSSEVAYFLPENIGNYTRILFYEDFFGNLYVFKIKDAGRLSLLF